ncbi:hypothetical protein ABT185_07515 [Streptomyces clavifer]|uniref:hypothetical protein n=1 Tax=Streptomyces clavifer TaxID=68188 RepID=UPI00332B23EE
MKIRADIAALLHEGHCDSYIARELHTGKRTVATARLHLGIPPIAPAQTPEQAWAAYAQPAGQGHMEWTGPRNHAGTPVFTYRARRISARAVAFKARYGRDPIGYVKALCDHPGCVSPCCVADKPMRQQLDTTFNAIFGGAQ